MLPQGLILKQNYPNPFNPITNIKYFVPSYSNVSLSVFNIKGQLIENLVNDMKKPGLYSVQFEANQFSSGIYFYQLKSNNTIITKKFIVIK